MSDDHLLVGEVAHRIAEDESKRLGLSRREFLAGPCGTAAALLAINAVSGCRAYKVTREDARDPGAARAALGGREFVLDAQTYHVNAAPSAAWPVNNVFYASMFERISSSQRCDSLERFACLSREAYIREVFAASDTAVAVLSGVPALLGRNPLDNYEISATRRLVNELAASERLLSLGVVHPNVGPGELEGMHELAERLDVVGWKVFPPWGPDGTGWFLDDPAVAFPFLERARKLRRPIVFCHKGLPWANFDRMYGSPRDIGPAAKQFPDVSFVVTHAGYEAEVQEGPYDPFGAPQAADQGVNRLIKSLEDNGIWPNQNVYADLSGAWLLTMARPVEAAHVVGKLLKHLGEDRVLWGSDALFLGSPQPQLEAFRAFQIPEELQEKYGYPALTPQLKAKILGLNAAALLKVDPRVVRNPIKDDAVSRQKQSYLEEGPRTRRELLRPWG